MNNQLTKEQIALAVLGPLMASDGFEKKIMADPEFSIEDLAKFASQTALDIAEAFMAESDKRAEAERTNPPETPDRSAESRFAGKNSSSKALAEISRIVDRLAENPLYLADTAGLYELCQIARIASEATQGIRKDNPPETPDRSTQPTGVPLAVSREFQEAVERLLDWMNVEDIASDHCDAQPKDYKRLNAAIEAHAASLNGQPTTDKRAEALKEIVTLCGQSSPPSFADAIKSIAQDALKEGK